MNFLKKLISIPLILLISLPAYAGKTSTIDVFKGLQRNPDPEYIEDGAFTKFDNLYVYGSHLQTVKGRVKLNTTANSNTTVNMVCYYENQAGSTKKFVVQENTSLATYDTDGSNRTSLNTGWINEYHSCKQVGDTLYITSDTDGLYKWTGSGAATVISGVSTPSNVDFSGSANVGGLTPGLDIVVTPAFSGSASYWRGNSGTGTCTTGYAYISSQTTVASNTSSTYKYKVTKSNSKRGFESEASTSDSATLVGNGTATISYDNCFPVFGTDTTCVTLGSPSFQCSSAQFVYSGKQTSASGTLASAPSAPFDQFCVYRTVANGSDYFKLGCQSTGAYTDGKPDIALSNPLDTTIDTIDPPSYKFVEEYKGSLFLAQGSDIYFTRDAVNNPDIASTDTYWLATDHLLTGTKEPITDIKATSNSIIISTANKMMELTGFGVSTFRFKTLYEGIGSISHEATEVDNEGNVIFFAGTRGVFKLKIGQPSTDSAIGSILDSNRAQLEHISSPALDNVFRGLDDQISLTTSDFTSSHAYFDGDRDLYFLFVGSHCFVYDLDSKVWTHIPGVKTLASVYRKSPGAAGQGMIIDNLGFFYDNFKGYTNGGPGSGTLTGSPTSSTGTTLTDSGASFYTTGSGLAGVWVIKDNGTTLEYRQITSNTGTALTVASSWTANPVTTDTYYVGYVIPDATTKMYSLSKPPGQTVVQSISFAHNKSDAIQTLYDSITYKTQDTSSTTSNDSFNLASNFIDKRGLSITGNWVQLNFRTYITNTSDTINPPLDIINYSIFGYGVEAE